MRDAHKMDDAKRKKKPIQIVIFVTLQFDTLLL
jgi:hypothetical protein